MAIKDTVVLAQALAETMASIKEGTSSGRQHRVTLGGEINKVDEWVLRQYISKTWTRQKESQFTERYISPCGNFRSLVIESGVVMITTWPHTPGATEYVRTNGMGGSYSYSHKEVW